MSCMPNQGFIRRVRKQHAVTLVAIPPQVVNALGLRVGGLVEWELGQQPLAAVVYPILPMRANHASALPDPVQTGSDIDGTK
jgi:hypothetical protein